MHNQIDVAQQDFFLKQVPSRIIISKSVWWSYNNCIRIIDLLFHELCGFTWKETWLHISSCLKHVFVKFDIFVPAAWYNIKNKTILLFLKFSLLRYAIGIHVEQSGMICSLDFCFSSFTCYVLLPLHKWYLILSMSVWCQQKLLCIYRHLPLIS